jgi:3-hydroxyacyl-CoA dehydrogenase/enoyl-CoA hydratase/3-hydroxybutyryl-CoA epimerase
MSLSVTHSIDGEGIGWIVFDDPAARANVFNPATQAALQAALDALAAAPVRAVVVVSGKERIFIAGADLNWLVGLPSPEAAAECARAGQRLLQRIADFKVPAVCAIHGACAGGGYELALACHWRLASDGAATVIGLPETSIGAIPGWGGGVRLPRLIGGKAAAEHILKGALVPAAEALRSGLVDDVVPAAELKTRAKAVALRLAAGGLTTRHEPPQTETVTFGELRTATARRTRGRESAPLAAIEVIEQGAALPVAEALEVEARIFGGIMTGEVFRNLTHVFFLKEGVKRRTVDAWFPAEPGEGSEFKVPGFGVAVPRVGVVGAGVMGSGIAQWCAARGHEVVLRDVKPELVERGLAVIRGVFDEALARKKMTPEEAAAGIARVKATTGWVGFAECDLVIEAIVENVAAKQQLFAELSAVVRADCVLASNTSALPIEELAATAAEPGRTIGMHFFNPVSRMPLVELVLSPHTTRGTAERALAFVKALGKSPVICKSSPGFLVTRVLFFYLNEACRLWEQGVPTEALDAAMRDWGWPMGPMRLIDEVGVDVSDFIYGEMAHYFRGRFEGATVCRRMLAEGMKGRKNGASTGFYTYAGHKETANPEMAKFAPATAVTMDTKTIADRLMGVMIEEAKRCLAEGVLKSPDDVDFALLMGAGFPAFRGGLMRYAKRIGVA